MIEIIKKDKLVDGRLMVVVSIDGNEKTFFADTLKSLKRQVRNEVEKIQRSESLYDDLSVGEFDYTEEVTPEPEPEPDPESTQEEIDRRDFIQKLNKLKGLVYAVELGLIANDDSRIQTARDVVLAALKSEYLKILANV